jgi:ADP-ribose pyrophosphatase YjhB (NUDIX family)
MVEGSRRPLVGVGGIVWRDDRVLLIRRGKSPRRGQWSLPGGRQEWGETVEEALRREVFEETALRLGSLSLVAVVDLLDREPGGGVALHYTLIDYMAEALPGMPVAGSDAVAVDWFEVAALPGLGLWDATLGVIDQARRLRQAS